jgi:hypothetical protein
MDHLAVQVERLRDMEVTALVTAGVRSNAVRMSRDKGRFVEPGTINVILLTNRKLTPRAMTRAIVTATEAKSAALMDLDVRSSYSARIHQATGTGTDNIIVVQGTGSRADLTGGHSKLGELMARAVYGGVRSAVFRQNGIIETRSIFQRLQERNISLFDLVSVHAGGCAVTSSDMVKALEEILLTPRYASFLKASLALSDSLQKGLVDDMGSYDGWCRQVAGDIAGKEIRTMRDLVGEKGFPPVLHKALNALLNGVYGKVRR